MSRVIVEYDKWSRMGNRMFAYAFGRLLAEDKKCEFISEPLPNFKNAVGTSVKPTVSSGLSLRKTYGMNFVIYDELLATDCDIIVDSYVQKASYYISHRDTIRNWFELDPPEQMPGDNELVIHVRETDYLQIGIVPDESFYLGIMDMLGYDRYTVVTDNFNSQLMQKMKTAGYDILSDMGVPKFSHINNGNIMRDFKYMLFSSNLLISHSSFSWWPAFLGYQKKVFFPKFRGKTMWKESPGTDDIDLFVENSNFIRIGR